MSAKAVKQTQAPVGGAPSQQGLVDSLHSEVSDEASPLLTFLVEHAVKIVAAIVLFIVAIGGYWYYESHSKDALFAESAELGKILVISDPSMRMERLEAFVVNAPESVKRSAWFSILDTAALLEDNEKLYRAWQAISDTDAAIKLPAALGMANALTAQDKFKEALDLLDGLVASYPESSQLHIRIALLAEMQGDDARALKACEALAADPLLDPAEVKLWMQKKDALAAKLNAKQPVSDGA